MDVEQALAEIAREHDGILRPVDVVEAARPARHPLHSRFEWDDAKAGHAYRLWQARELIIQARVTITGGGKTVEHRCYVSLGDDRRADGGGYRQTVAVLSDADLRAQMLDEALTELRRVKARYSTLTELADVWEAMSRAERRSAAAAN